MSVDELKKELQKLEDYACGLVHPDVARELVRIGNSIRRAVPPIATQELGVCEYCGMPIAEDEDFQTGVKSWYSDEGDYGCKDNDEVDEGEDLEDGCGPHVPMRNS